VQIRIDGPHLGARYYGQLAELALQFENMRAPSPLIDHFSLQPPRILYHYTSLDVFTKIVDNGELWASNVNYMNDSTEYAYAQNIIRDRLCFLSMSNDLSQSERDTLKCVGDWMSRQNFYPDAFVTCFSELRDDLSQWRGYSPPGLGVCIGFYSSHLKAMIQTKEQPPQTSLSSLGKVIYASPEEGLNFDDYLKSMLGKEVII
jgi:Protein of unknown function (DUF2971)